MRVLFFSVLLWSSCLYIGGKNSPPQGEIAVDESTLDMKVGGGITLQAVISDPEEEALSYQWIVQVTPLEDGPRYYLDSADGPNNLSYDRTIIAATPELILSNLPLRGWYQVDLVVFDSWQAQSQLSYSFSVTNQAPSLKAIRVEKDPLTLGEQVPDLGQFYPVHAHYQALITNQDVEDLEGDLVCGSQGSIHWSLEGPGSESVIYLEVPPCHGSEIQDGKARFRLDGTTISQETTLTIRAKVEDGYGGAAEKTVPLDLTPNRPPCLELANAAAVLAATIPIIHDDAEHVAFDAGRYNDDVPEGFIYTWFIRDEGAAHFISIPGQQGPVWQLPSWYRPPGHRAQIRVVIQDLYSQFPDCLEEELACRATTMLPEECYQWITWSVEFR